MPPKENRMGKKNSKRKRPGLSAFPAFLFCFLLIVGILFQGDQSPYIRPEGPVPQTGSAASPGGSFPDLSDAADDLDSWLREAGTKLEEILRPEKETQAIAETPSVSETSSFQMTVLDVGQGLSVLVQSDGHFLLYDGGDRSHSSFVVSYLLEHGVSSLDYVIASHYDADHLNGVIGALSRFPVDTLLAPDYETDTKLFQSYQELAGEKGLTPIHPSVGDTYVLGSASFTVLGPVSIDENDSNNNSLAIRIAYGDTSFLLTGDAGYDEEPAMCSQWGNSLSSTVYVAGHHGSGTSSSWELLQNAVPEYVVISCGKDNSYGHPHDTTMEKLEAMEIPVFRTDLQGTVSVVSDGHSLTWSAEPCNDYSPGDES